MVQLLQEWFDCHPASSFNDTHEHAILDGQNSDRHANNAINAKCMDEIYYGEDRIAWPSNLPSKTIRNRRAQVSPSKTTRIIPSCRQLRIPEAMAWD